MTARIRPVLPGEHERTGEIVLSAYDAVGNVSRDYRAQLRDTAARNDDESTVLVAVDGGEVIGTVTLVTAESVHFEHAGLADGGFRALAVAPSAQRDGVGRALVEHTIAHARSQGWRRVAITTLDWMQGAQELYDRLGFERRPDLDVRFPEGTGVAFTLDLSPTAAEAFPAVGPVPDEPPWYEDVWADRTHC